MSENEQPTVVVGTVIQDSYGNPAVVLSIDHAGRPRSIMQTVGSDLGHVTHVPRLIVPIYGPVADAARERARVEWRRRGMRRSTHAR